MATYHVNRDQAVWERERFEIEVPDHIPLDERRDYVHQQLDLYDQGELRLAPTIEITGNLDSVDIQIEIEGLCDEGPPTST